VVHYEQDPPIYADLTERMRARYEAMGAEADLIVSYLLDQSTLSQQAQGIISRLKAEGITSVVFGGDPFMLIDLTTAATRQNYFPEWIITGTVFTDTTTVARLLDQQQWANAFGASASPARGTPQEAEAWRVYKWFQGTDPEAKKSLNITWPPVQLLFTGIHMAGPNLTPETFAGGMFRVPPAGGGPTTPQISYGNNGVTDGPDFVGVDDFTVVWWDPELEGPNEQEVVAPGMWRYPLGGQRFLMSEPQALDVELLFKDVPESPGILTEIPATDRTPDYDPPAGAPAAGG